MKNSANNEYNALVDEIINLENENMSIDMIDKVKNINGKATYIYLNYLKYAINTYEKYQNVLKRLHGSFINKMKAFAPELSNEGIENAFNAITYGYVKFVDDLILCGDTVAVKGMDCSGYSNTFITGSKMHNIAGYDFLCDDYGKEKSSDLNVRKMLIGSINNFLRPLLACAESSFGIDDNNEIISYNFPNLSVYFNCTLPKIEEMIKRNDFKPIYIVIVFNDELYYLKLKVKDNYWIVIDNSNEIWKLSNNIKNSKQLTLK